MRSTLLAAIIPAVAAAAVPIRWTVETSRVQPAAFEAYQGETLALEAVLTSRGKPFNPGLNAPRLYWQTNGMGSAYWSAPGAAASNVVTATWSPSNDVGAAAYNCFIGEPGSIYRAAFQLRLRPSPGTAPNTLPLPTPTIDFARVTVLNPPWPTNAVSEADAERIAAAAVAPVAAEVAAHAVEISANAAAVASHSTQLSQLSQSVAAHTAATDNPHQVTAEQVIGLNPDSLVRVYPYDEHPEDEADWPGYFDLCLGAGAQMFMGEAAYVFFRSGSYVEFDADSSIVFGDAVHAEGGAVNVNGNVNIRSPGRAYFDRPDMLRFLRASSPGGYETIEQLIARLTPPPGNYAAVSNAAMSAYTDATNYVDSVAVRKSGDTMTGGLTFASSEWETSVGVDAAPYFVTMRSVRGNWRRTEIFPHGVKSSFGTVYLPKGTGTLVISDEIPLDVPYIDYGDNPPPQPEMSLTKASDIYNAATNSAIRAAAAHADVVGAATLAAANAYTDSKIQPTTKDEIEAALGYRLTSVGGIARIEFSGGTSRRDELEATLGYRIRRRDDGVAVIEFDL